MEPRNYPAKVLLYGEHTVLRGGRGLAVPYPDFHLRWSTGEPDPRLLEFANYLARQTDVPIDVPRLRDDLGAGARLSGNIPTGYGLGSSGAVCAAVWDRYRNLSTDPSLKELRQTLATLETHFHGSSSGTDPLISYLQTPVLLEAGGAAGAVELPGGWAGGFFLLDTGRERSAFPLIRRFLEAYDRDAGPIRFGWETPADAAIRAILSGNGDALYRETATISAFQLTAFPDFIPKSFHDLWNGGDAYRLKLCGAGGGGMLLGLSRDHAATASTFGDKLRWLTS